MICIVYHLPCSFYEYPNLIVRFLIEESIAVSCLLFVYLGLIVFLLQNSYYIENYKLHVKGFLIIVLTIEV